MQYKNIKPGIIIEELLEEEGRKELCLDEIEIYCFNGKPKLFQKIVYSEPRYATIYDENFKTLDFSFKREYVKSLNPIDDNLKKAVSLSSELALGFKLVRVDWAIYKGKLYFNEMTFTPVSGFFLFEYEKWNYEFGKMLELNK